MKEKIKQVLASYKRKTVVNPSLKSAAVLIPLYEKDDICQILFTERTDKVQDHKGQISFPGGSYEEKDRGSIKRTMLREVCEELGVVSKDIEILGELDDFVTTSNYIVTPLVGEIPYPYDFKVSSFEIARLIEVPVKAIISGHVVREDKIEFNGQFVDSYIYEYEGNVIWGVTARIVHHFIDLIFSRSQKEI